MLRPDSKNPSKNLITSSRGALLQLSTPRSTPLYQALLADASLPCLLLRIDVELAADARAAGCQVCGASLHSATFPRKVRGGPWRLGDDHDRRLSFCCSREGCRRRLTPPSVRFISRHVYLSMVVVLAGLLIGGPTPWRVSHLAATLGVSRRTVVRWRSWWQELAQAPIWRRLRGRLPALSPGEPLPAAVLTRSTGAVSERAVGLLRLLAPLSASTALREGWSSPAEDAR